MDGERFFRGLILLEELLKELYAIAHTKARLFALQKLARLQQQAEKSAAAKELDGAAKPSVDSAAAEALSPQENEELP
jgi:hypothetical protein